MSPKADETLNLLVYNYFKSSMSQKLAREFQRAAGISADDELPEDHADIAEIVRIFEKDSGSQDAPQTGGAKRKAETEQQHNSRPAKKSKPEDDETAGGDYYCEAVDAKHYLESNKCFNCEEFGHFSRDCPTQKQPLCYVCKEEGHLSRFCPKKPPVTCYNCQASGHLSRDCPLEQTRPCYNCDLKGHIARDCDQPARPRGGGRGRGGGGRGRGGGYQSHRAFGTGANTMELGQRGTKAA